MQSSSSKLESCLLLSALSRRRDGKGRWRDVVEGREMTHTSDWRVLSHHTPAGFSAASRGLRASNHTLLPLSPSEDQLECIKRSMNGVFCIWSQPLDLLRWGACFHFQGLLWTRGQIMLVILALWGPDANTSWLLPVSLWRSVRHSAVEFNYTACSQETRKFVVPPRDSEKGESDTSSPLTFHSRPGLQKACSRV